MVVCFPPPFPTPLLPLVVSMRSRWYIIHRFTCLRLRVTKALEADGTLSVHSIALKDGEQFKNLTEVEKVRPALLKFQILPHHPILRLLNPFAYHLLLNTLQEVCVAPRLPQAFPP